MIKGFLTTFASPASPFPFFFTLLNIEVQLKISLGSQPLASHPEKILSNRKTLHIIG
jgi:hypothetical protein